MSFASLNSVNAAKTSQSKPPGQVMGMGGSSPVAPAQFNGPAQVAQASQNYSPNNNVQGGAPVAGSVGRISHLSANSSGIMELQKGGGMMNSPIPTPSGYANTTTGVNPGQASPMADVGPAGPPQFDPNDPRMAGLAGYYGGQ